MIRLSWSTYASDCAVPAGLALLVTAGRRGVEQAWLRELVADWGRWDPNGFQDQLDAVEHLSIDVDGQVVHAVHAPGQGPDPMPLILTHGWPRIVL